MKSIYLLFTLFALVVCTPTFISGAPIGDWPKPIVNDPGLSARRELLISHGITPVPGQIIRFLNEGFDLTALTNGLPAEPEIKIVLVNSAIKELGNTGSEEALPILTRIVNRDLPDGIQKILRRDFEPIPMNVRGDRMNLTERLLSLNAIVALGLIGNPQAEQTILNVINTETGTAFVTKGAIALGQMGSNKGIGPLVILASDVESADSQAAFQYIYLLTGQNYGVSRNTSLAHHKQIIEKLQAWYELEGHHDEVYRSEIIRRLKTPLRPEPLDGKSLRGLLRMSRDLSNYENRWFANAELKKVALQRFDDLKVIAKDPFEDLDIRRSAMEQLVQAAPKKSRSTIRHLKKSEDKTISDLSVSLEGEIERFLAEDN
jgi:HEAT repeat protein